MDASLRCVAVRYPTVVGLSPFTPTSPCSADASKRWTNCVPNWSSVSQNALPSYSARPPNWSRWCAIHARASPCSIARWIWNCATSSSLTSCACRQNLDSRVHLSPISFATTPSAANTGPAILTPKYKSVYAKRKTSHRTSLSGRARMAPPWKSLARLLQTADLLQPTWTSARASASKANCVRVKGAFATLPLQQPIGFLKQMRNCVLPGSPVN